MDKLIFKYNSEDAYDYDSDKYDYGLDRENFECAILEANTILSKKNFVRVNGSMGLWNGPVDVDQIIEETNLEDIINKYIGSYEKELEIDVYNDKVIMRIYHHDGTNYYELVPINLEDLKIKELKAFFDEYDIEEFNTDDGYGGNFSHAKKNDLINFIEFNELYKNN